MKLVGGGVSNAANDRLPGSAGQLNSRLQYPHFSQSIWCSAGALAGLELCCAVSWPPGTSMRMSIDMFIDMFIGMA